MTDSVRTDASAPDFRMPDTRVGAIDLVTRIAEKAASSGREALRDDAGRAGNELLRDGLGAIARGEDGAGVSAAVGPAITGAEASNAPDYDARRIVASGLAMIADGKEPDAIRRELESLRTEG